MANWLIHDGSTITNAIVADSKEIAEQATGLQAFPASDDGIPWIGWSMIDGEWTKPSIPNEDLTFPVK